MKFVFKKWPVGNEKQANILEMASGRAKRSEIWDSVVLEEHVWGTFDLAAFTVIWGSFDSRVIFLKYDFQNVASSTFVLFQPNFL